MAIRFQSTGLFALPSWLLAAALLLPSFLAAAATATSRAAGNWNANATWSTTRSGTITSSPASATVTGSGTAFLTELAVGVVVTRADDTVIGTVQTIASNTSLTLTGNASNNNSGVAWAARVAPAATDAVQIQATGTVQVTADATCASLAFLAAGGAESLAHNADILLTVNGNVTITGSSTADSTKAWNINAGRAQVNGNVTLVAGSTVSRIAAIFTTARSTLGDNLTITGSLTLTNPIASAATVINMSGGNGVLNLAGALNIGTRATLTPGATSIFNYNGSVAQSIPIGFGAFVYRNLHVNNTSAAGATLANTSVTSGNVLGNIRVQSGILNNGGFAITGGGGNVFEVANGTVANPGRFNLTGATAMATGFTTKTFGATSIVNYKGGNQTVSAETYGHLILDGGSTKTPAVGTTTVAGDFTLGAGTTFAGSTNNYVLGGNFTNSGTAFTAGTGTYTFNGSAGTPQTLTGVTTFTSMTVNNTGAGLLLASDFTVTTASAGTLVLTRGNIDTAAKTLTVARNCNVSATVPVDRSSVTAGWVVGNLIKTFPTSAGTVSCSFEVGDASSYAPLTSLTFSSVSSGGVAQVRTDSGDHADTLANISGIDASNSVNRTWTLTAPSGTTINPSASFSATFNFNNPGDLDASPTPASFVVAKKILSSGNWTLPPVGTQGTTSTQATNMVTAEGNSVFAVGALKRLAEWRMDAATWVDSSGNGYTGTGGGLSGGLPTVSAASPAIAGSPGTCGYGVFNRNNKTFVSIPASFPNLGARSFTITAWIRTTDNTDGGQRVLTDDEHNTGGYGLSVGSGGTGTLRFYSRGTPSAQNTDTSNVINNNTWYFIAAVADVPNKIKTVYVFNAAGGLLDSTTSPAWTESSFGSDTGVVSIGGETNASTQNTNAFGFGGNIDEVRVYESALGTTHLNMVRQITHSCSTLDHLDITGNAAGITCAPEDISFTAHDASHNPVAVTGTLSVGTGTAKGDWASVIGGNSFSNGAADDGQASIQFSNESSVTLRLTHTYALISNINASLGGVTEASGSAGIADDLSIAWAHAGFKFFQDTTLTPVTIGTQIAGKPSNVAPGAQTLFLRAIKTDNSGACTGVFANPSTVNVDMASQCNDPVTCSSQKVTLNSTQVASNPNAAVSSYTPVSLAFGSNSQAPVIVNSADAGRMTLHARYTLSPSGQLMTGASNAFVVRPFAFRLSGAGIPGVSGPGGTVFASAGANFPLAVTAVAWEAADDTNADGVQDAGADLSGNSATLNFGQEASPAGATLTHTLLQPAGGTPGVLSGGTYTGFASGTKTQNLNWSEVGSISLSAALTGGNYLASAQSVTGSVSPVGRFRPDHFILAPGTLTNRRVLGCSPTPSTFTYLGEQLRATFTLTARNALASPTTTTNYTTASSFAKLDGTVAANFGFGAVDLADATPPIGRTALTSRIATGTSSGTWVAGAGAFTADFAVNRAASPDGPFESFSVGALPADTDGVTLRTADFNLDTSSPADTSDRGLVGSSKLRFGRLRVQNALGMEKLALPVPIETQYWNGSVFIRNADDSCTTLANSDIVLSDYRLNLAAGETLVTQTTINFANGTGTLTLSPPGPGNNGSLLLTPTLGVNRPYLQGAWTGTTYNENPSARASFGLFGGQPQNFIFRREIY